MNERSHPKVASQTTGEDRVTSITPTPVNQSRGAYSVADAALGSAIVSAIRELRPDLPIPVVRSLAVEVVDQAKAGADWAAGRAAPDPDLIALAYNRHVGQGYERRRAAECAEEVRR